MDLTGKHIIVTGVSKGIGLATVEALLEKGAIVYGWGRNNNGIQNQNYQFFQANMAIESDVEHAFQATIQESAGRIDGIINNAGYGAFSKIEDMQSKDWENLFAVNVHGIFYTLKRVVPIMKAQQSGTIVNISSIAGLGGINEASAYCGTKFAVRGISQSIYAEVKKHNVRVTCIFPGSVNTHFFDETPVKANPSMIGSQDIAQTIVNALELPDHVCQSEIEIRPVNPTYA